VTADAPSTLPTAPPRNTEMRPAVKFALFLFASLASAQSIPDLEGIWQPQQNNAMFSVLPHKPGFLLGTGSKTGIVEGGVLPYQPWAAAQVKYRLDHMDMDPTGHCHYEGVPHAMYFPFQLFQTGTDIAMVFENMHAYRIIHMQGQHPKDGYQAWMGDSVGRWDGETLVIDVTNLNDKTWLDSARHTHSDQLHVVERYTRLGPDVIAYEATIEDPKTYSKPWKIAMPLHRITEAGFELREQECMEGDSGRAIHPPYRPAPKY